MPLKIWLFLDSRANGGIESHVMTLAKSLIEAGQKVTVVLWQTYGGAHPMVEVLQQSGVDVVELNGSLWVFIQLLSSRKPHVVHAHGYKASLLARLFKWKGYRQVSSFHAGEVPAGKVRFYDALDRYSAAFSDNCIAISREIALRIRAKSFLLNNFVELPKVSNASIQAYEIAFVGRLSQEKAPERFIALARQFPSQQFAVYGDGPLASSLRATAPANVVFYGMVPTMNEHWCKVSLLCMPSRYEGLPMAALEAMAHGVPVMASPVGELINLVDSGRNGWLLKWEESQVWFRTIKEWLALNSPTQYQFREAARHKVEQNYSASIQLKKLFRIYRGLGAGGET